MEIIRGVSEVVLTYRTFQMPPTVSDNPQTFHQALLLMSSLARLAPEAVLRHVMPIFTFMGSNILHRDDSYSFKVVQKVVRFTTALIVGR